MRLPRNAYISSDYFSNEQDRLFSDVWVFAGVTSDFHKVGDYKTVNCGAYPLAVVMQRDGELIGLHNICRHRGAELLDGEAGNAGKALVCPYHRWTYGLDGALRGAPDMASCFPNLDRAALPLKSASVGVFKDLVFINPNPAADFHSWTKGLVGKEWPHDLGAKDLKESAPLVYDVKCNWKIFVENAIDGYHLAYLHKETLGGPSPDQNVWEKAGDNLIWYATDDGERHRLPGKARKESFGTPKVKSAAATGYGGVYYLFPSTLVVPTPYGLSVTSIEPVSAERCTLRVRDWVGPWQSRDERKHIPGYDPSTGIISSDNWTMHALDTGDFQTEDVWICEKVQRGLRSPAYEHGPLARGAGGEEPIEWFHSTIEAR